MTTGFNTQIIDGMFHLQFETDKRENYEYVQAAARDCLDGKATDKCHRWISVEERLPENDYHDVLVLVVHSKGSMFTAIDARCKGKWIIYPDSNYRTITHWTPMPEPPEVTKP